MCTSRERCYLTVWILLGLAVSSFVDGKILDRTSWNLSRRHNNGLSYIRDDTENLKVIASERIEAHRHGNADYAPTEFEDKAKEKEIQYDYQFWFPVLSRIRRSTGRFEQLYETLVGLGLNKMCKYLRSAQLDDVLSSTGTFTIFAPNDEAFALVPGGVLEQITKNPEKLREFLLYHIIPGALQSSSIQNEIVQDSLQGTPIRFNVYGEMITVNGAKVVNPDGRFENNAVYAIDRVLYPVPSMDLVGQTKWTQNQLYRLLEVAGVDKELTDGTYTVFAPSDEAFQSLPQRVLEMLTSNVTLLKQVLLNHVLKGTYYSVALNDGLTLISIGGAPLTFQDRRGLMLVNSIPIVEPDFAVLNGVIHIINRVLLPSEVLKDCQCLPHEVQSPPSGEDVSQGHPQSPPIQEIPPFGSTPRVPPSDKIQTSILQQGDPVPSLPRLETVEGSPSPARNEILEVIKMPGLNVQGQPISLNIFYELLQTSDLVELLSQKGPFTVLVPTDDAFANLPDGVLEELRNNPQLLHRVLLTHIIGLSYDPQTLHNNMVIETNNGLRLFINILNNGKIILIEGSKLIASTVAQNGYVYVINRIIYPLPGLNIFSDIKERPNLSQLLSLVIKSGLQETLGGDGPYTIFAPTDEAFAAVPESVLQELLSNSDALQELIMNHVVEGAHYKKEFSNGFILPTSRGQKLQFFLASDGVYRVNDANIQESDISTGNGVIHVIDRVLFAPPVTQPGPGTPDDSQVQQQPQLPEKPLSGQSNLPTTGPSSEQEHPQPGHEVSTSGQPEKPPSQEVFVRTDGGQVPSLPRLEVEGVPPPTNTILQVIKMPGLNVQGQPVSLTIFYELLQKSGLLDLLSGQGPFTVFIPNDDAFANLPAGVLEELRNNPELLRRVLLSHVVNRSLNPKTLQNNMIVETNNNRRLFVNVLNDGKLILIGGAKLIASTKVQNGEFYVINRLIYPIPRMDIFTELKERPTLSQLVSLVMKSGLQDTLVGEGPYTIFAPTDEAFAAIPESVLQELLSNQDALREFIINHVVEGVHYKKGFTSGFILLTSRGKRLQFFVTSDGVYRVNDANFTGI
ncbi:uncharacterized protein LOC106460541 [Limulus polyphemus]|uniref:Uncharacterized protein LOC106460541 n=1 Tax=Limulus polyphemus TaxID=6850 RepID=A0ABM1B6C6_LIMPO|nr:uncharacterized protein LOC106460541 [Limulus polyphemus]